MISILDEEEEEERNSTRQSINISFSIFDDEDKKKTYDSSKNCY